MLVSEEVEAKADSPQPPAAPEGALGTGLALGFPPCICKRDGCIRAGVELVSEGVEMTEAVSPQPPGSAASGADPSPSTAAADLAFFAFLDFFFRLERSAKGGNSTGSGLAIGCE